MFKQADGQLEAMVALTQLVTFGFLLVTSLLTAGIRHDDDQIPKKIKNYFKKLDFFFPKFHQFCTKELFLEHLE